jgi:hypothetical protein
MENRIHPSFGKLAVLKRVVSSALITVVLGLGRVQSSWSQSSTGDLGQIARMRAAVAKRGVEDGVKVQPRDQTQVKGYVQQIGSDTFALKDEKTGTTTSIHYRDVHAVKGKGLSKAARSASSGSPWASPPVSRSLPATALTTH